LSVLSVQAWLFESGRLDWVAIEGATLWVLRSS